MEAEHTLTPVPSDLTAKTRGGLEWGRERGAALRGNNTSAAAGVLRAGARVNGEFGGSVALNPPRCGRGTVEGETMATLSNRPSSPFGLRRHVI